MVSVIHGDLGLHQDKLQAIAIYVENIIKNDKVHVHIEKKGVENKYSLTFSKGKASITREITVSFVAKDLVELLDKGYALANSIFESSEAKLTLISVLGDAHTMSNDPNATDEQMESAMEKVKKAMEAFKAL